jgi:hypothetical protein
MMMPQEDSLQQEYLNNGTQNEACGMRIKMNSDCILIEK